MRTETISFGNFMRGTYNKKKLEKPQPDWKAVAKTVIPIPIISSLTTKYALAAESEAIPAGATEWMGEKTLQALAHVLDPVVDIMVALSFPVASVVIVGACFFFMFGNNEKAWTMITNSSLGYVLIQVSPLILNVLKQIGNAV